MAAIALLAGAAAEASPARPLPRDLAKVPPMHLLVGDDGEHAVLHDLGGAGPPLLLTHGNGLNHGMWAAVVPHLVGHFHCYGLDFRGHGAARPTRADFSVDRRHFVAEVLAAAAHLGPGVLAAGHSLGGATLVRAELEHPGTFGRLWVFEPVIIPPGGQRPGDQHPLVIAARKRRRQFDSVDAAIERLSSKPPFSDCDPVAVRAYVTAGTRPLDVTQPDGPVVLSCHGDTEARIFTSGVPTDFATLAAVTTPTVVARGEILAGANDLPPLVAGPVADALGAGSLRAMAGLTHFGPMEDGSGVAEAMLEHLVVG